MAVAALDGVDPLSDVLEALDELGILCRVRVAKSELPVRVVLAERVDKALLADKEAKVAATGDFLNPRLLAERHPSWQTLLHAILGEWPCESIPVLRAGKVEVASSCHIRDLDAVLGEGLNLGWLIDVLIVAEAQLAFLIGSPDNKFLSLLDEANAPVLDCDTLLQSEPSLILNLLLLVFVDAAVKIHLRTSQRAPVDVHLHRLLLYWFCALAIVVPAPDVDLALAVDDHRVAVASGEVHDW